MADDGTVKPAEIVAVLGIICVFFRKRYLLGNEPPRRKRTGYHVVENIFILAQQAAGNITHQRFNNQGGHHE